MEILCLVSIAIFWLVILPAMQSSGAQSQHEDDAAALNRLTKP